MLVPEGFVAQIEGPARAVVRTDLAQVLPESWWRDGESIEGARGRGGVTRRRVDRVDVVLRTYRRGGLSARFLPDWFASPRRALEELHVLDALGRRDVPVVEPVVVAWRARGLGYELRLGTVYEAGALPLPEFVVRRPALRRAAVRESGRVVALAFDAGLEHPDLHPDNLIARAVEGGRVEVRMLDFDRARIGVVRGTGMADAMLVRMARYLLRHHERLAQARSSTDLLRFLAGMGRDRDVRRETVVRLSAALARQAMRRNLPMLRFPHQRQADLTSST